MHLGMLHVCVQLLLADVQPACLQRYIMPRKTGGIGRTGSKHKKAANFDVHRQVKGADGPLTSATPATANPPEQSALEVDAGADGALHT